jgi:predicted solute-binding protein
MRTVIHVSLVAAALAFLISLLPMPLGQYLAQRQADKEQAAFQEQLQADIESGRVVRFVTPDGRVEYRNAANPQP